MRIALFIPDGISIRNYLYSDVIKHLAGHDLHLIHHLPEEILREALNLHSTVIQEHLMPGLSEDRNTAQLRKICTYVRLRINTRIAGNSSIKNNWLFFSIAKRKQKIQYKFLDGIAALLAASPVLMRYAESVLFKKMMASSSGKNALQLLKDIAPDVILCTHQRSVEAGYIMTAATQLKIKTLAVIFSWDNLPKSRINFKADRYLIWSQWMKKDLQRFYPELKDEQLLITGTPQFEFYLKKDLIWTEEIFRKYFNVPPGRAAVCFSGNEPSFPSDHLYLQDLLEDLEKSTIENKPFIIVRPSPNDHTSRFADIIAKYPKLATLAKPAWKRIGNLDWESNYPTYADNAVLSNLVHYCHAVINVGSTMGLDFAQKNKLALYIRYNHPACAWFDLTYGYAQEHFKSIDGLDAVVWVNSREIFLPSLIKAILHPDQVATERLKWKRLITDDITDASKKVANALTDDSR